MTESDAKKILQRDLLIQIENKALPDGIEAIKIAIKALEEVQQYRQIGTVDECREAVEKQTAISREIIEGKYFCPKCHNLMPYPGYCGCGQKVY
jgi:hypothetical protein